MDRAESLDAHQQKSKSYLNPPQFKPTNTSSDQQQHITPGQKKIGNTINNNNLTWIEGKNYHAKNTNMTKFFHNNE